MRIHKRSMASLLASLLLCAFLAGCSFLSSSENGQNENITIPDNSNDITQTNSSNDFSEQGSEHSSTDITDPDSATTYAQTTKETVGSTKPRTTTKRTTTKPTTTAPATTKPTTTKPATTAPTAPSILELDGLLGKSGAYVRNRFGSPVTTQKSEYGFIWQIYHNRYSNFVMIGIKNDKVVGLYSNSARLRFSNLAVGATKSTVRGAFRGDYTGPLSSIIKIKNNTEYRLPSMDERDVFSDGQKYVTMFYDNIKGGKLTAIQIIEHSTEQNYTSAPSDQGFTNSCEAVSFQLINSIRARFNKSALTYDNNMVKIARAHSQDMIDRSFDAHQNPDGLSPGDRIKASGYTFSRCAESISRNYPPSIVSAHESFMNSSGHRANTLGDYKNVGVGVRIGMRDGKLAMFQTQLYITYG